MNLYNKVCEFIEHPFPLWECEITEALVQNIWNNLNKKYSEYSTARSILGWSTPLAKRVLISGRFFEMPIYMDAPSIEELKSFYDEHGLVVSSEQEAEDNNSLAKLKSAFNIIAKVEPINDCIENLVRSIHIIKQEDLEIDSSYSNPQIPFSIFVSVCENDSVISSLRVAESILHEAMHLKLTLIENIVQLVMPHTDNLYFSPWRDEKRPAQGVLHGLFVFRAILDFLDKLEKNNFSENVMNYIQQRKEQISYEIFQLKSFHLCEDLTPNGAILTKNLLPLN